MSLDRVDPSVPPIHGAFEQAAQLIEKLAELRRQYAHPGTSAFDHINIECDAMLSAADKLRHPDNAVLSIPTWLEGEWEAEVTRIRDELNTPLCTCRQCAPTYPLMRLCRECESKRCATTTSHESTCDRGGE